jgi:RND family efflux transporter MFP subunit
VLSFIALPLAGLAAPTTEPIGAASATLTFIPDPPHMGINHAVITLSGDSPQHIARTKAAFGTRMPAMSMSGPSGTARQTGPGRWEFDATLGMAAAWDISVKFSGDISGTVVFPVTVGATSGEGHASGGSMAGMKMSGGDHAGMVAGQTEQGGSMHGMAMPGMPGMSDASDGSSDVWKTAAIAMLALIVIGGVALRVGRQSVGLFAGLTVAAVTVVGLGLSQEHFFDANPAVAMSSITSDMSSMADVHGSGPIPITVARVRGSDTLDPTIAAPGSVQPYLTQDVVARSSGLLSDFTLYTGDRVRSGQIIARLDEPELGSRAAAAAADARAQRAAAEGAMIEAHHHAPNAVVIARNEASAAQRDLDAARADVAAKREQTRYWRAELAREGQLLAAGAVSEQEYADERAQAAAAEAALSTAQDHVASLGENLQAKRTKISDAQADVEIMLAKADEMRALAAQAGSNAATEATIASYRDVIAPNDGIIIKRMVDPGVYVQAGTVLARVAVLDHLRVQAQLAQDQLPGVTIGTPLQAVLSSGVAVRGRVSSIQPVADPATHTATVEAIVENPNHALLPGGFVNVTLRPITKAMPRMMQVPSVAIVGSGAAAGVWTIVDGTAHRVPVKIISDDGTTATIEGHLTRGAPVAVEGASTLEEGEAVETRDV